MTPDACAVYRELHFRWNPEVLVIGDEIRAKLTSRLSIRALYRELRILARKEPVNQLTQKAESECSRLSALKPWISKGLRRFGDRGASFSSEPVALGVPEPTMRVGLEPREQPFRTL